MGFRIGSNASAYSVASPTVAIRSRSTSSGSMGENATAALDTFAFFATIDARAPGTGSRFGGT